jgi:hypothetical protein
MPLFFMAIFEAHTETVVKPQLKGYYKTIPWKGGTKEDALRASIQGLTIPMSSLAIKSSKDGKTYTRPLA